MKSKLTVAIIISLLVLILLAITTPDQQDHLLQLKQAHFEALETMARDRSPDLKDDDHWLTKLSKGIAQLDTLARESAASLKIDTLLSDMEYSNYVVFSLTCNNEGFMSLGILNQIIVSDDQVSRNLETYF